MASPILDVPPPSPQLEEAAQPSLRGLAGPEFPDVGGAAQMGHEIERMVLLLAQVFPAGAPRFDNGLKEILQGIADGIESMGQTPGGAAPEDVGRQFPGGPPAAIP